MTKEELEKEAEDYANKKVPKAEMPNMWSRFYKSYIAGAEPREEQIEELERKLEQIEKDLADYQFNYPTIKELQKENAELRNTETMLKVLKDRGVIKSWYYNGSYHVGNELPR